MSLKAWHHILLGRNEQLMCTKCKTVVTGLEDMYIETVQVAGLTSEVTETLCKQCRRKEVK